MLPDKPMVFMKLPTSSVPPSGPVRCPAVVSELDYEAELVVVIGQDGKVGGWAVGDDVSARDLQRSEEQWTRAKGFDTFCPVGSPAHRGDWRALEVIGRVNGEVRQHGRAADMVFGVPDIIAYVTRIMTLEAGDIIATGSPGGVGLFATPQRFLKPGDRLKGSITALGTLTNSIV